MSRIKLLPPPGIIFFSFYLQPDVYRILLTLPFGRQLVEIWPFYCELTMNFFKKTLCIGAGGFYTILSHTCS
jgi:hypothetical protein